MTDAQGWVAIGVLAAALGGICLLMFWIIEARVSALNARIDALGEGLGARIDALNRRLQQLPKEPPPRGDSPRSAP